MTPSEVTTARIAKGYLTAFAAGTAYDGKPRNWQRWEKEGKGHVPIPQHAINWLKGGG